MQPHTIPRMTKSQFNLVKVVNAILHKLKKWLSMAHASCGPSIYRKNNPPLSPPLDLFVVQHSYSFKFYFPNTFICRSFTTKKYTFIFHFLSQSSNLIYGRIQFFRHLSQCYRRYCYDQRQQIALSFRQIAIIDGFIYFFGEFSGFFGIFLFFHSLAISVKRYFCLGCLGCLGYSRSIAPSSNVGLR